MSKTTKKQSPNEIRKPNGKVDKALVRKALNLRAGGRLPLIPMDHKQCRKWDATANQIGKTIDFAKTDATSNQMEYLTKARDSFALGVSIYGKLKDLGVSPSEILTPPAAREKAREYAALLKETGTEG